MRRCHDCRSAREVGPGRYKGGIKIEIRFCPSCGAQRQSDAAFCGQCGARIVPEDEGTPTDVLPVVAPPPVEPAVAPPPGPFGGPPVVAPPAVAPPSGPPTASAPPSVTPVASASTASGQVARTVTVIAALALAACAFLPWIDIGGQGANGFDVPMSFLWDEATTGGIDLAYLVLGLGGLGLLLSLAGNSALRRLVGGAGIAIVGLFAAQISKLLEGSGTSAGDAFGTALYVGLVASIVLATAPAPKSS